MPTAIYAPKVTVRIFSTKANSIIDVSDDISSGSVQIVRGPGVSTMDLTLANGGRKYDTLFSPMDRFVVYLRRLRPLLVMSGYLDSVPIFSAAPGSVRLAGSSTMKLLQNFYWDPGTPESVNLFTSRIGETGGEYNDGGLANRAIDLMTQVAGWEKGRIHIGGVPQDWFRRISKVAQQMEDAADAAAMSLEIGGGVFLAGENPEVGSYNQIAGAGLGTGILPATSGKVSFFGGPNGGAYGKMALTGEDGVRPRDPWYCAMRWPYVSETGGSVPGVNVGEAKRWWADRRILVHHPRTGKTVILRAADWGPHLSTGRVLDISPQAMTALGAKTDDVVKISFAEASGKTSRLGPVQTVREQGPRSPALDQSTNGLPGGMAGGWGSPGQSSNMRTITVKGCTFTVHRQAVDRFAGFITDLVDQLGYQPREIGGYNARKIAGTNTWSNHAYGAAIDIDPTRNPYYASGSGGRYDLPRPPQIIRYARKWGLGWGGEWRNSKDYMHFEVLGAPASSGYNTEVTPANGGVVSRWITPVTHPFRISARFGESGANWANGHSGTDFAVEQGRRIRPVGPGKVHARGSGDPAYGNWIAIDHGSKVYTFYAHMQAPTTLSVGDLVTTSSTLGKVGQTGNVTGPHLHIELRLNENTYAAALASGGIEKYVLGDAPPPRGTEGASVDAASGTAGDGSYDFSNIGGGLLNVSQWYENRLNQASLLLTGYRALMNDEPILNSISEYMGAGFRDFGTAPNGDFIAWFPDYYGWYGTAGKMIVSPLEIDGVSSPPTIRQDDTNLKTHHFVTGSKTGFADTSGTLEAMLTTAGIASIEQPELLQALLNVDADEAKAISATMLRRIGARPSSRSARQISGPRQEFYLACMDFMDNWSQQFNTSIAVTFMPEIYPGMLACFPTYGIQGYVREVRHDFDTTGGGFTTSISAAPWSTIGERGPGAIPRGAPL